MGLKKDKMFAVEDFKTVIERRKRLLSDSLLQRSVFETLDSEDFKCKVCVQLNIESCLDRNWRGLAMSLIQPRPDMTTIERLSNCRNNEGYETVSTWLKINEEGSFDELLQAMVECKVYAAADELLNYLESVDHDDDEISEDGIPTLVEDVVGFGKNERENFHPTTKSVGNNKKPDYHRSKSWRLRIKPKRWRNFSRSKSLPEPLPEKNEKEKNGIFIVSSNADSETVPMKRLLSFVQNLKRVKKGEWHVDTIHDLPGGPMATTWLQEKVETAVYVLICFSEKMKEVFLNSQQFAGQSECNLKFALDCLITGNLYLNMCYNHGGKFLPILLPGNDLSCMSIMQCLALFKTYNWPKEQESIKKYLLNLPERTPPPLGPRKPLVSKELPN